MFCVKEAPLSTGFVLKRENDYLVFEKKTMFAIWNITEMPPTENVKLNAMQTCTEWPSDVCA